MVLAIAVFVSVISCRETEELTTIPGKGQIQSISAKIKEDSIDMNSPISKESNSLDIRESDPPPKNDEIKW